jgi:putative membrane protein
MADGPYARFKEEELILRDLLAAERTSLANERTFLAYVRTALAFAIAGGSLIHFLDSLASNVGGGALLTFAVITFGYGLHRFLWYRRRIKKVMPK